MGRIRFANQLRGIAALSVACSHLIGIYWYLPSIVSSVTATPPQSGAFPDFIWLVSNPWINPGPLGVALFFLISGFVIPFSLEKHTRTSFILARLLRIYPTYMVAFGLELAVVTAASNVWGRPLPYTVPGAIGNALLIYDFLGQWSLDLVNWTLAVELKFYLLAALLAPAIRRGSMAALVAVAACILAANVAGFVFGQGAAIESTSLPYVLSAHSVCLIYMLIGTAFNAHVRGLASTPRLLATIVILTALFLATWLTSVWAGQFPVVTLNYAYGILIFSVLYAGRRWVPPNPVLDAMAAISFPFYVIHSLIGYSVLRALMVGLGWAYNPALLAAFLTVLATATLLHLIVERPTTKAGRHLAASRVGRISPNVYHFFQSFGGWRASKRRETR